ncbi:MAG TPA: PIG-L deacetylase family protein [Anaerolineales bacterium]
MAEEFIPKSAMSVHAHPDDQDFTVAGTLAKWSRAGCQIISVIITSGDAGSNDPNRTAEYKAELAKVREEEQHHANVILGVKETIFLRYPDGELVPSLELRKDLTRLIRRYKPEVVVTGDPSAWFYDNDYVNHPDHRAAAEAAIYAVFPSAGTRMIFTELLDEGLQPHDVKRLYIHGNEKPDTWVDIAGTLDLKIQALTKHFSQRDTHDIENRIREWAQQEGKASGIALAEAFRVMILHREEDIPRE